MPKPHKAGHARKQQETEQSDKKRKATDTSKPPKKTDEVLSTPKKKGRQGKKDFEEKLIQSSTWDLLKSIYGKELTDIEYEQIVGSMEAEINNLIAKDKLPGEWDCPKKEREIVLRHFISAFGVEINQKNCLPQKRIETIATIKDSLALFIKKKISSTDLKKCFKEKFGLVIDETRIHRFYEQYKVSLSSEAFYYIIEKTIESQMMSAIVPSYRQTTNRTEMELTRQVFGPLFHFTTLFNNCYGSNCSIGDFLHYNDLGANTSSAIPDFRPDDFTCIQYNNHKCIRLIREDCQKEYEHHTMHKDFIPLLAQMKLSLSFTARKLVTDSHHDWYSELCVLGITSEKSKCHLYSLFCTPVINNKINLKYRLSYIGTYAHFNIDQRINLIATIISNLCLPNIVEVANCITTKRATLPSESPNKTNDKQITQFPTDVDINLKNYIISYQSTLSEKKKIEYCTINNVPCVVKRVMHKEESVGFLSLYLHNSSSFSISLKGTCLADMLRDTRKVEQIDVNKLCLHIMTILYCLESINKTHNDIKPENIVYYEGYWFLIDYETSTKFTKFDVTKKCYTINDKLLVCNYFSPGYRSPERMSTFEFCGIQYEGMVSPQSDVYSFGLVLLEVLYKKRLNGLEFHDNVLYYLNNCKFVSGTHDIVKGLLPQMLEMDFYNRKLPSELIKRFDERMDHFDFLSNISTFTTKLFPKKQMG